MSDLRIEAAGGGQYDLALVTNGDRVEFDLIGLAADTWPTLVTQRLLYAYNVWLGESRFATDVGFPWLQGVFGEEPLENIGALVYQRGLDVEGVENFASGPELTFDPERRELSIVAEIQGEDFVESVAFIVTQPT